MTDIPMTGAQMTKAQLGGQVSSAPYGSSYDALDRIRDEGYTQHDLERWAPENSKSRNRTAFERDRARIVHSSALRRLGSKTQILVAGTDDFARTRLTHTLEVAQIGRQIAQIFGCDPDIVDCACLSHDLGHPPFGHNGERILASLAEGIGGFEGNAQTFRLLTRLEPKVFFESGRSAGVNLTRAALDAATKYPWTYAQASEHPDGDKGHKFCVYPDDSEVFEWLRQGSPAWVKPMECQVMDLADDIAYSVHDVEDAIVGQSISVEDIADYAIVDAIISSIRSWYGLQWDEEKLSNAYRRLRSSRSLPTYFDGSRQSLAELKNMTSNLIGRFASSVEAATRDTYGQGNLTRYHASVVIPEDTSYEIMFLKGIAVYAVMEPRELEPFHMEQRRIIEDLVEVLMSAGTDPSTAMEPVFYDDWYQATNDNERLRVAIDQVASLTDVSALALHRVVCG